MPASVYEGPRWPLRLKALCAEFLSPPDEAAGDRTRGEIWKIFNLALAIYLRHHASRLAGISREDLEDIASDKSLDLMHRMVQGKQRFHDRRPAEIMSFFSKVARNELMDLLKERGRWVEPKDEERPEWEFGATGEEITMSRIERADLAAERQEFSRALLECAETLAPRSRLVWFFRVFYEMASKDIAVHPRVLVKPSHVDVLLQRSREKIRECMQRQGFQLGEIPPGTFAVLWRTFHRQAENRAEG